MRTFSQPLPSKICRAICAPVILVEEGTFDHLEYVVETLICAYSATIAPRIISQYVGS